MHGQSERCVCSDQKSRAADASQSLLSAWIAPGCLRRAARGIRGVHVLCDTDGRCRDGGKVKILIARWGRREQRDQAELKVGAIAVIDVLLVDFLRGPVTVVRAFQFTVFDDLRRSVLMATAEADDHASLQAAKDTLQRDGGEDNECCERRMHVSKSIRPSWGGVQS